MQPDCGENPCTPNTLIRNFTGTGWRADKADQPVFLPFPFEIKHFAKMWEPPASSGVLPLNNTKGSPMLKLKTGLVAGALSLMMAVTSAIPAQAITFARVPVPEATAVEKVQYRYERRDRRERRAERRWHGHHGYRERRPGYRRHSDGFWYPLAAFGLGAAIGGAIANQPSAGGSHAQWCANRYRSYRAYDNTYQPNYGPRKQCVSPY